MLTTAEAAERLGRHPATIRRWIRAGKLRARKVGPGYVIDEADIELALADSTASRPDWTRLIRETHDERDARLLHLLRVSRLRPTPQPGVSD